MILNASAGLANSFSRGFHIPPPIVVTVVVMQRDDAQCERVNYWSPESLVDKLDAGPLDAQICGNPGVQILVKQHLEGPCRKPLRGYCSFSACQWFFLS